MPRTLVALLVLLALAPAAQGKPKARGAADAGMNKAIGQRVTAPWGRYGKRYPGQVVGQYGKYVEVKFDDGYTGWCSADLTSPPVEPLPKPPDSNRYHEGDKVLAKWSLKGRLPAVVVDTYGDLVLVNFESDDRAWVRSGDVHSR